jgi:hypothetical protein
MAVLTHLRDPWEAIAQRSQIGPQATMANHSHPGYDDVGSGSGLVADGTGSAGAVGVVVDVGDVGDVGDGVVGSVLGVGLLASDEVLGLGDLVGFSTLELDVSVSRARAVVGVSGRTKK